MTGFEEYRLKAVRKEPDWSPYYVEYAELKSNIASFWKRRMYLSDLIASGSAITKEDLNSTRIFQPTKFSSGYKISRKNIGEGTDNDLQSGCYHQFPDDDDKVINPDEVMTHLASLDRSEFCYSLDRQVEKAASFYGSQLALFSKELTSLKKKVSEIAEAPSDEENTNKAMKDLEKNELSDCLDECKKIGDEFLELFAFVVTNIITLRQILIRYDAYARTVGGAPLTDWYMESRQNESAGFNNLFQFESLISMRVIFALIVNEIQIKHMRQTEENGHPSLAYMQEFNSQFNEFKKLLEQTHHSVLMAASGKLVFKDHFITSLRDYFLLGSIQRNLNMEPRFLRLRGRHLKNEISAIEKWRKTKELKAEEKYDPNSDFTSLAPENVVPLILNLLACFLYMMNNYIVEPSSAYYANALGESDALGGMVIGAMPMANIGAAVGYSIWTNYSYRRPLFFAGILIVIGNIMYSFAYNYRSVSLCLIGRAITGLGGPRLINRRYVADATPYSLRTAASASFAAATSLGAAMGPAGAIVLDFFDFKIEMPFGWGNIYVNGMTGPGYLMAFLWTVHLILLSIYFNEPTRVGLEELKQREQNSKEGPKGTIETCFSDDEAHQDMAEIKTEPIVDNGTCSCFQHITYAVRLCMLLIFIKRITLESVMGSTSILTKNRYGWSVKSVGLLQFINGLLVIPCSIISGWSSQFYEDRYMMLWLLSIATFSIFCLIDFSDLLAIETETYNEGSIFAVGPVRYILGNFVAFGSIESCESFVASALSKVVPSSLASGTFNSGLLTTLVGTSGRTAGDVFITTMGYVSLRNLMNLLFVPSFFLMVLMVALVWRNYDMLAV